MGTAIDGEMQGSEPSLARRIFVCLIGGLLLGMQNLGTINATSGHCSMSAYANQTFFSLGVFLCTLVFLPLTVVCPVEGGPAKVGLCELASEYRQIGCRDHFLGIVGGFGLCIGFFCYNIAL